MEPTQEKVLTSQEEADVLIRLIDQIFLQPQRIGAIIGVHPSKDQGLGLEDVETHIVAIIELIKAEILVYRNESKFSEIQRAYRYVCVREKGMLKIFESYVSELKVLLDT